MKRFIFSAILIFVLTGHAFGMGWFGGGGHHSDSGTVVKPNSGNGSQSGSSTNNGNSGGVINTPGDPDSTPNAPVKTPEPTTMLLLGAGLIGFIAFRRKFRK